MSGTETIKTTPTSGTRSVSDITLLVSQKTTIGPKSAGTRDDRYTTMLVVWGSPSVRIPVGVSTLHVWHISHFTAREIPVLVRKAVPKCDEKQTRCPAVCPNHLVQSLLQAQYQDTRFDRGADRNAVSAVYVTWLSTKGYSDKSRTLQLMHMKLGYFSPGATNQISIPGSRKKIWQPPKCPDRPWGPSNLLSSE